MKGMVALQSATNFTCGVSKDGRFPTGLFVDKAARMLSMCFIIKYYN